MKHLLRNIFILASILLCFSVFLIPESHLNTYDEILPAAPIAESSEPVLPEAVPVTLSIESVGIDAAVASVGILGKAMAVPTNSDEVGWYELGVKPGDIGSAVLAGHVNWYGGKDAVFTNLHDIEIGDVIVVTDSNGETHSFAVREMKRYELNADADEVFMSDDGQSHLNLITCDGPWNSIMGSHELRLVVFADKIQAEEEVVADN